MDHADLLCRFGNPRLLKRGGQKTAYRVVAPQFGEAVVKVGHYASPISLERAQREVDTLGVLNSPYYPRQYNFQVASGNRFVVIEEYIISTPLADCLGQFSTILDILKFIRHLVAGLRLLWDKRIVHRDVKPDNILVRPNGWPVVIDLGIARLLDADSLTLSHAARGPCTPVYAAPEQLRNRKAQIDARTDQFAIGIILMQMVLGGRHPFDPIVVGSGESIVHNILNGKWYRPNDEDAVPPSIVDFARRLLGHEPHDRYRFVDMLTNDLDHCLEEAK